MGMVPKPQKGSKAKTEDQIMDEATTRLLQAVKKHAKAQGKPVTSGKLRREGYSDRFIAKVEEA